MKCDFCSEHDALIHVQQIFNGEVKEIHLCPDCAGRKGLVASGSPDTGLQLGNILGDLVGSLFSDNSSEQGTVPETCAGCGLPFEEFLEKSRAGCSECYNHFHSLVYQLIGKEPGVEMYRGRIPKRLEAIKACLVDKALLKKQLEEALEREDYEKAAKYRDAIANIENGL
jgi:protein arginine kinase activator